MISILKGVIFFKTKVKRTKKLQYRMFLFLSVVAMYVVFFLRRNFVHGT